jgi:hypothetical protein
MSARLPLPMFTVRIKRHGVPPRWIIPARAMKVPAPTAEYACRRVVRWALSDAGAPPLRSIVAHSMRFTTAKQTGSAPRLCTIVYRRQLRLFDDRLAA